MEQIRAMISFVNIIRCIYIDNTFIGANNSNNINYRATTQLPPKIWSCKCRFPCYISSSQQSDEVQ